MRPEIADLLHRKQPLPKGTHIVSRIGGVHVGGTHELKDFVLAGANRVPNHLSEDEPFWIHGWRDLHHELSIPTAGGGVGRYAPTTEAKENDPKLSDGGARHEPEGCASMTDCECKSWCSDGRPPLTEHHRNCPKRNLEAESVALVAALIKGIECWAADEDGVHPDAWDAYRRAIAFVGDLAKLKVVLEKSEDVVPPNDPSSPTESA